MSESPDYYSILGVPYTATPEQITIAFSKQVERFPPEARDPHANAAFRSLVAAYKILSDVETRATFDKSLGTHVISGKPRPLTIQLLASQTTLLALQETQIQYVLLEISANPELTHHRTPVNFCLVVDRSTSMSGERIQRVKGAAALIAEKLNEEDTIAVVAFSDFAEVIVPAGSTKNIQLVKAKISQLSTGGATEMLQGLRMGLTELYKTRKSSGISHLVLLTDGHTYGDEQDCIDLASQAARDDISISAVGIGHQWNDRFLDALVAPSGSTSNYLDSPSLIVSHLEERIQSLNQTFAHSIQLRLDAPAGIELRDINRLVPSPQPIKRANQYEQIYPLGSLPHHTPLSVLMELGIQPQAPETSLILKTRINASIIPTAQRDANFNNELAFKFSTSPSKKPPLPAVVRAVNKLNLYRLNEKVWEDVELGEIEKASQRMEALATRLHHAGHTQLAKTALQEAHTIAQTGHLSDAGRIKLKYGTRSLIGYDNLP